MTCGTDRPHPPRRPRPADGFTLVEVVATLGIIVIMMTTMLTVFLRSVNSVSLSRQRQEASALASEAMEQMRALPYTVLTSGLVSTDLSGDSSIVSSGGTYRLRILASGIDEPLMTAGATSSTAPLYPHVATQTKDRVTYTVSSYVTQAAGASPFTLTVLVRWSSDVSGGTRTVIQRSAAFSPSGCLSPATHPFAGPCQDMYSGVAGVQSGAVTVASDTDPTQPIVGFTGTSAALSLADIATSMTVEQTGTATTTATTTGATVDGGGSSGALSARASASSDPTTSLPQSSAAASGAQTATPRSLSGAAGSIVVTPSGGDTASSSAYATSATSCVDPLGGSLPTGRPCTAGSAAISGADASVTANLTGTSSVRAIPAFDLARFRAATAPGRSVVAEVLSVVPSACPTATTPGCTYAAASRSLGSITLGGLPAASGGDTVPAGFAGVVTLTGLSETLRAEAGDGERPASFSRTGTLRYWNGSGYTSVDLSSGSLPSTLAVPAVTGVYPGAAGTVTVTATPAVTIGSTSSSTSGALPCVSQQCTRSIAGSAITVTVVYRVTIGITTLTRFAVTCDLGSLTGSATYAGAQSA